MANGLKRMKKSGGYQNIRFIRRKIYKKEV